MQNNAVQCSAMQCNMMQYDMVQYNAMQYKTMQDKTIQNLGHVSFYLIILLVLLNWWECFLYCLGCFS